jgi:hypothetical protein
MSEIKHESMDTAPTTEPATMSDARDFDPAKPLCEFDETQCMFRDEI